LDFKLNSFDDKPYGMNTPAYFAMDNLATGAKPLWTGAGNNKWSNTANWSSGEAPGSGQNIIFSNNTNPIIDLDGNRYIANMTFDTTAGAFTFNNNTLTPDAGGSIVVASSVTASQTFNCNLDIVGNLSLVNDSVASGQKLNVAGNIQSQASVGVQNLILGGAGNGNISGMIEDGAAGGTLGLIKQGAGVWTLTNDLDYAGVTLIQAGLLQLNGAASNLGDLSGNGRIGVGNGVNAATLSADSIAVNTLTIAAGAKIVIRPIPGGPLASNGNVEPVPEPHSLALFIMAALGLFMALSRRQL
jgi:autotransporter-associated beta strand protein